MFRRGALLSVSAVASSALGPFDADNLCGGACSDHMVLEANGSRMWGFGAVPNSVIRVSVDNATAVSGSVGKDGSWTVELEAQKPGIEHEVRLETDGGVMRVLTDVAFGMVILCSGQSNMDFKVTNTENHAIEIADAANYPDIRLSHVCTSAHCSNGRASNVTTPQDFANYNFIENSTQSWARLSPESVSKFSAVCYYTARDTYKELTRRGIAQPIGLVQSSLSGSTVQAWTSSDSISACNDDLCPAKKATNILECSNMFNGAIHPLLPMRLSTVLWYQGEGNSGDAPGYACRFPALVNDWRAGFGYAALPFFFVEVGPTKEPWIREAQRAALLLDNVGFVSDFDLNCGVDGVGGCNGVHSPRKQEVGRRLALKLLAGPFGLLSSDAEASGPQVDKVTASADGDRVRVEIRFKPHSAELHTNGTADCQSAFDAGKAVTGPCCARSPFALKAADGTWIQTELPQFSGNKVVVVATVLGGLENARDIAYAFEAYPPCAIYADAGSGPESHTGLPATPWRRSLQKTCPTGSTMCEAAGAEADVQQAQCCGPVDPSSHKIETCFPGMGCYGGHGWLPKPDFAGALSV